MEIKREREELENPMNFNLRLLDQSEFAAEIDSHFCTKVCENSTAVLTSSGVLILEVHPNVDKPSDAINFRQFFIHASEYLLIEHLESRIEEFIFHLRIEPMFSILLQHSMIRHLDSVKKRPPAAIHCCWSPLRLIGARNLIAVMNDLGSLDLYIKIFSNNGLVSFEHVFNLTQLHIEKYKWKWSQMVVADDLYAETLKKISLHTPKAMVFTEMMTQIITQRNKKIKFHYCVLIVAYADGRVVFWQINQTPIEKYTEIKPFSLGEFETDLLNISAIHWHHAPNTNSGLLVIGTSDGAAIILPVHNLVTNRIAYDHIIELNLSETNGLSVDHIDSLVQNEFLIIMIVHHDYLFIHQMNAQGDLVHSLCYHCEHLRITQFQKTNRGTVLLLTLLGTFKELQLNCTNEGLVLEERDVYVDVNLKDNSITGLFLSQNNAIFSIFTRPTGYFYRRIKPTLLINFADQTVDAFNLFYNHKYNYQVFDLLEVLRVTSFCDRDFICNRLSPDTDYDRLSLIELKKYFFLSRISEVTYDYVELIEQYNLKQAYEIETMIKCKLAVYLLRDICQEIRQHSESDAGSEGGTCLTQFKRNAAFMCSSYLKDSIIEHFLEEHDLLHKFADDILQVLQETEQYNLVEQLTCHWCGDTLTGNRCMANHVDNRCAWTMVQITNSKYKCPVCVRYVSENAFAFLKGKFMTCPFCDAPVEAIQGPTVEYDDIDNKYGCPPDCIQSCVRTIKNEIASCSSTMRNLTFCD